MKTKAITKTKLVQIGRSRGVRLPKAVIERAGLGEEIEVRVVGKQVILGPETEPRAGWDEAMKRAVAKLGPHAIDHEFLDAPLLDDSDLPPW